MREGIAIAGIGETPPARRSDKDVRALVIDACIAALDDAGIAPSEVDGIMSDAVIMPGTVSHEYVCAQLGIDRRWDASLSFGGAANAAAPLVAEPAIASGLPIPSWDSPVGRTAAPEGSGRFGWNVRRGRLRLDRSPIDL